MKPGRRALGVAESYQSDHRHSTIAGAVVRADRVVDGLAFSRSTVGGIDVTDAIAELYLRLDREDIRYVLVAGIALSWYNLLDLRGLHAAVDRPVIAVSFEESHGLEPALRDAFDGEALARRLERYRDLPPRTAVEIDGRTLYYRSVGIDSDETRRVLDAYASDDGRPEPLRVAKLAARGARDAFGAVNERSTIDPDS